MRSFRIEDNARDRGSEPLVLIDEQSDEVVRVHQSAEFLVDLAFAELRADVVIHDDEKWRLD